MAHTAKAHAERLNELLDAAQQFFFERGYERTSVNDIISKIGVAKGTFYHYFKSKEDLLDKLVERFVNLAFIEAKKLVERTDMKAVDKMNKFFITIRNVKVENIELMKMFMKVLYTDENLMLRYKMFKLNVELFTPELAKIIRQGREEGIFDPLDAEETARLIFSMSQALSETTVALLLEADKKPENIDTMEKKLRIYERAVERILRATEGTFSVIERRIIEMFKIDEEA